MSQGTNDAADNWTGQVKGQGERERTGHPGPTYIIKRERAKGHLNLLNRYLLRSSSLVPDMVLLIIL